MVVRHVPVHKRDGDIVPIDTISTWASSTNLTRRWGAYVLGFEMRSDTREVEQTFRV
jgi:hypothetical protein